MRDQQSTRLATAGMRQENEEQAWRLWTATARRAVLAVRHKRFAAAEIYWRAAFELALRQLAAGRALFTPVHLLEPMQGLAGLLIEQGRWKAARSLFNEVSEFFYRQNIGLPELAERLLHSIAQRIAQAQNDDMSLVTITYVDNIEDLPLATAMRGHSQQLRSAGAT